MRQSKQAILELRPAGVFGTAANDSIPTRLDVLEARRALPRLRVDGIEVVLCAHHQVPLPRAVFAALSVVTVPPHPDPE